MSTKDEARDTLRRMYNPESGCTDVTLWALSVIEELISARNMAQQELAKERAKG